MKIAVEGLEAVVEEEAEEEEDLVEVVIEIIEMVLRANANSSLNLRCTHNEKMSRISSPIIEMTRILSAIF